MHLYKCGEWESNGKIYVNDTSELAGLACEWWVPARIWGIAPAAYVELLVNKYKVDHISFNKILIFSWDSEHLALARKYKNELNKRAREINFTI